MSPELDKKLCDAFPLLYRDRNRSQMETCMCWGFSCEDGWFQIIWDLSEKIEKIINKMKNDGVSIDDLPVAAQVKEKFGSLKFYVDNETTEIYNEISKTEKLSTETCEICGKKANLVRQRNWLHVLCDMCKGR